MNEIYTIGHSNHDIAAFIALLRQHDITALCDVRSRPYSRYAQHYSREALMDAVEAAGIAYIYLGKELGARSDNSACYKHGRVQYTLLAKEPLFLEGIDRVTEGMKRYRIALMCAEKEPAECHRALLVSRQLFETGIPVSHIFADSSLESHGDLESRLLALCKLPEGDMFNSRKDFVAEAYLLQGERVAYKDDAMSREETFTVS